MRNLKNADASKALVLEVRSFLLVACGVTFSTSVIEINTTGGILFKIAGLAFVCFCLYMAYNRVQKIADQ